MSDTSREAKNVLRRLNEMGGSKTSIIFIVLDTTGSMKDSFEAVKLAIINLNKILSICGINIVIITYGDYYNRANTIYDVTAIHLFDTFNTYNFRAFPTGDGGDTPEAVHSAFCRLDIFIKFLNSTGFNIIKPNVIFITDAPPHTDEHDVYFQLEKRNVENYRFNYTLDFLREYVEKNTNCSIICTTNTSHIYTAFGQLYLSQYLSQDKVLKYLLIIINTIFEENPQVFNFNTILPQDFCTIFRDFVKNSPTMLEHLSFLSNQYYKNIRHNQEQLKEHSKFVLDISNLPIPPGLMEEFKNAQTPMFNIKDLYYKYEGVRINTTSSHNFSSIKDLFGILVKADDIINIKKIIQALQITDGSGIPIEAIDERLELLASAFCIDMDGNYPQFEQGVLPILACGVVLYCTIPEIVDIFTKYIMSPRFLTWLSTDINTRSKPNDTMWNRIKLQFIINAVSKLEHHPHIKVLMRLSKMVEIISMFYSTINPFEVIVKVDKLNKKQLVQNIQHIPMFPDILLQKMFVSSIGFKVSYAQVCEIIINMKRYNSFYKKSDAHYENIRRIAEKNNGLVLSIYSINCHIKNNDAVPDFDGTHYGYQDKYAVNSFVNDEYIVPNLFSENMDEVAELYEKYVGQDGQYIFQNLIQLAAIKEYGPQMVTCCSRGCNNVYMRQDSSSLGREGTKCGTCRRGVRHFPMYTHTCHICLNTMITGIETPQSNSKCPFCMIPETTQTITNISMQSIMKENSEYFAKYFGIPLDIFEKLLAYPSMAKLFRENPEDMNTAGPIPDIFFNDHGWNEIKNPADLIYKGGVISPASIQDILQEIENKFLIECGICYATLSKQKSKQICQNKQCFTRYCDTCISSITTIKQNVPIYMRNLQCPHCTTSIKPKIFTDPNIQQLFVGPKGERPYDKMNDKTKLYLCTSVECTSKFPFCIEQMGACGAEAEAAANDTSKICTECEHIASAKARQYDINLDDFEKLSTGHYHHIIDEQHIYIRPCPTCNTPIQHSGGCFHMKCVDCLTHFCWCCGFTAESTNMFEIHPIYTHLNECEPINVNEMRKHIDANYMYLNIMDNEFDDFDDN